MPKNYTEQMFDNILVTFNKQNESIENLHEITKSQQRSIKSLRTNVMLLSFSILIITITTFIHLFTSIYKGT